MQNGNQLAISSLSGAGLLLLSRQIRQGQRFYSGLLFHFLLRAASPLAAILCLAAGPVLAQQSTSATYDDWVVRCVTQAGAPPQKVCDMDQLTQVQGQTNPLSRVAVRRAMKDQPVKLVVQLPINVWLQTPVKIQIGDKDPGLVAPFQRCVPAGCFAEIDLKDDVLKKFRGATAPGKIEFKNAAEKDVTIPLSFKGFGSAFDALLKE